jgi:hypothetical protein
MFMPEREGRAGLPSGGGRGLLKSTLSFSWAQSLFGLRQFGGVLAPSRAAADLERVGGAAAAELDEPIRNFFRVGDRIQRETVNMMCGTFSPIYGRYAPRRAGAPANGSTQARAASVGGVSTTSGAAASSTAGATASTTAGASASSASGPSGSSVSGEGGRRPYPARPAYGVNGGRLDASSFVVLGEGLAAGMGDFTLSEETQRDSFPAQMARQMQTDFPQPLVQAPGICYPVGFAEPPVLVPQPPQDTVFRSIPPAPVRNLSVPGLRLGEALSLRPAQPLVRRDSHKLTALNLALGVLHFARGDREPAPTQLGYALSCRPTFALVELGFHEALEAAVSGDARLLPAREAFRSDYARLVGSLRGAGAEVLALNVPDPLDTAHFSTLDAAARVLKVEPEVLVNLYGLRGDEFITAHGLNEIGFQLFGQAVGPLPPNATLGGEAARRVSRGVAELNEAIDSAARQHGALVYDLHGLFRRLAAYGYNTGTRLMTAEYLGGFYTLNGYYPGAAGHALIANEILNFLNVNYGADFPQVNIGDVCQYDPVANYRQAEGPCWTLNDLPLPQPVPQASDAGGPALGGSGAAASGSGRSQQSGGWEALGAPEGEAPAALRLPPGLEQILPLSKAASYFGDGIGATHCRDQRGVQFGGCGNWLFGGLALVDSHLSGNLRLRFTPPENNVTRFELSFEGGFVGEDAVLTTPQFFKMWFRQARVDEAPGLVSSGTLNLATGAVSDLTVYAAYSSTALFALVGSNPNWPRVPITFKNESSQQYYGSAWARFDQREDGLLDFTFYGSMFAPVGPVVWPLNFVGPSGQFATVPAAGTVMHPHLHLSTKEPARGGVCPDIPFNTVQELTLFTHNSSFGDAFTLDAPQLGGRATGRSHLLGRVLLQYGVRSGNTVPVAVSLAAPGGVMQELEPSPITAVFPGRLYPGPNGFDEFLRFPLRTYSLDDLAIIDDPFDISVGAVDLRTGRFLGELLHRGFINQDLIFALLRVEPRTPGSSFNFRGPARLERGAGGSTVFRFKGEVFVPYPEGFLFPKPNLTTGFPIGPNSRLDPFLWLHAIQDGPAKDYVKRGEGRDVVASTGARFSYRYAIPKDPSKHKAVFEYENHSQQGRFRLHSLAWVGFADSQGAGGKAGEYDTVSFTGFGVWSKDGVETIVQASAQISTSRHRPYVGIQLDSGDVSNVNTKPPDINDALP